MGRSTIFLAALVCALALSFETVDAGTGFRTPNAMPIKNVVVLMEENRSFDHMLGHLNRVDKRINGLVGNESQPRSVADPSQGSVPVNQAGFDISPDDPCHSFSCVTEQIYGFAKPAYIGAEPKMNGFVQNALRVKHSALNPVSMFNQTTVPILSTLALEGALFDNWFAAVPTCTYPNRMFAHSATSYGVVNNSVPKDGFPQETVFDRLSEMGLSWRMYYFDSMAWALMLGSLRKPEYKGNIFHIDQFYADAKAGNLPAYTFIEPQISDHKDMGPANSQHPDASVRVGEKLQKDVYESVRASPQWNDTLLIFTYDEHGGFYDHVPPPQEGVPSPDDRVSPEGFKFDRLGIRIPTVMISPWIPRNTLISQPDPSVKPFETSQFDLSSIPATLKKIFGWKKFFTKRDAWAATFENILSLKEPRTDYPMTLPDVLPPDFTALSQFDNHPPTDMQQRVIEMLCEMNGRPQGCGSEIDRRAQVSEFLHAEFQFWLAQ